MTIRMLAAALLACAASPAAAQDGSAPATIQGSASAPATLMRVDDGVFDLVENGTLDLTGKRILLGFFRNERCRDSGVDVRLNGRRDCVEVGERIDLKRNSATRDFVGDRENCFLDIVRIVAPKGAPATATFRLYCL